MLCCMHRVTSNDLYAKNCCSRPAILNHCSQQIHEVATANRPCGAMLSTKTVFKLRTKCVGFGLSFEIFLAWSSPWTLASTT